MRTPSPAKLIPIRLILEDDRSAEVTRCTGAKFLLTPEGLLPYFTEEEHRRGDTIVAQIAVSAGA
jgi:hypothetical protein